MPEPTQDEAGRPLTIAEHLEELRRRLGVSLLVFLIAVGVGIAQAQRLVEWLRRPIEGFVPRFAFFSPTEPLLAYVKVGVLGGLVLAMPVLLWELWAFVRTGLKPRERSLGLVFVWGSSALFLCGAAFAYYGLLPISLKVLLAIGQDVLEPVLSIDRYLSFVTTLAFWCGVIFQLPAVLLLLAKVGIVTSEWLRQQRPYAILVMLIVAAIITPTTDPITLLLMAVPMVLLYEGSILLTRVVARRRAS